MIRETDTQPAGLRFRTERCTDRWVVKGRGVITAKVSF